MSESNSLEIPGHLTLAAGKGGLPKAVIETRWSSAEIYLHGAHVTHFRKKGEVPLLFMSAAGESAPGKPIRGGVPIIFPWFGPREGFPAHGFARSAAWDLKETELPPDGAVKLRFSMPDSGLFEVEYLVTVAESLSMELTSTETAGAIRIAGEVDRVYLDTAAPVEIEDPALGRKIRIATTGSNSTVVWNPWIEKSKRMADFGDDEYLQMVRVESGNVANNSITLPPGGRAVLKVDVGSEPLVS